MSAARAYGKGAALEAGAIKKRAAFAGTGQIHLHWTFVPGPRQRKSDDDGRLGAMKSARDGIADALHVDDSRFLATWTLAERGDYAHIIARLTLRLPEE